MSDLPTKSGYQLQLEEALCGILDLLYAHNERFGKIHASLAVLRRAIASLHSDPETVEAQLHKLEADAQTLVLEGSGFPETSALANLLKYRKRSENLDS